MMGKGLSDKLFFRWTSLLGFLVSEGQLLKERILLLEHKASYMSGHFI